MVVAIVVASICSCSSSIDPEIVHAENSLKDLGGERELDSLLGTNSVKFSGPEFKDEHLIHAIPHLVTLGISDLTLDNTDISPASLDRLDEIETLCGLGLRGSGIGDEHIANLPQIHGSLSLKNTNVTNAIIPILSKHKFLKGLTLDGTSIDRLDFDLVGGFPSLDCLTFESTKINDAEFLKLVLLPKLRHVNVHGTPVTKKAIKRFEEIRPECVVATGPYPFDD